MKGRELTEEELSIQTCNAHHNAESNDEFTCVETIASTNSTASNFGEEIAQEPKDYTLYLSCLTGFIALFNVSMILFFNAPFKRSLANKTETKPSHITPTNRKPKQNIILTGQNKTASPPCARELLGKRI